MPRRLQYLATTIGIMVATACSGEAAGPTAGLGLEKAPESGDHQVGMAGRPLARPLRVLVRESGRPAAGVTVIWKASGGSIVSSGPTSEDGAASATWTLPRRALRDLRAYATIEESEPAIRFEAESRFPDLAVLDGAVRTGTVGQEIPLRVVATWDGAPVSGEPIVWSGSGLIRPGAESTDQDGIATATWRLPTKTGAHYASARVAGLDGAQASFTVAAFADAPAELRWLGGKVWLRNLADAFGGWAKLVDQYGNGVAGVSVDWTFRWADGTATQIPGVVSDRSGDLRVIAPMAPGNSAADFRLEGTVPGLGTTTINFKVVDFLFIGGPWYEWVSPAEVTVAVGSTVLWGSTSTNHRIAFVGEPPPGVQLSANPLGVLEREFDTVGEYTWYCDDPAHLASGEIAGGRVIVVP